MRVCPESVRIDMPLGKKATIRHSAMTIRNAAERIQYISENWDGGDFELNDLAYEIMREAVRKIRNVNYGPHPNTGKSTKRDDRTEPRLRRSV
jgi:hypothetical protein